MISIFEFIWPHLHGLAFRRPPERIHSLAMTDNEFFKRVMILAAEKPTGSFLRLAAATDKISNQVKRLLASGRLRLGEIR